VSTTPKFSLRSLLYERIRLREALRPKLGAEGLEKASTDYHARKPPIQCGATIHSVVGCTFQCTYCYLPDMGVSFEEAQPYGLSWLEMVFALLSNEYFLPGLTGTYLAFGSLGEPLHPAGLHRTLEYVEAFSRILHNPMQLSTKTLVPEEVADRLARVRGAPINVMVTIVALSSYGSLEPRAPPPSIRLESLKRLSKAGLKPTLFLRPVIPGLEDEAAEVIREARRHGAVSVVIGSLRVTPSILDRLRAAGVPVEEVLRRVGRDLRDGAQASVPSHDLKAELVEEARRVGLTPLLSACCANTLNTYLTLGVRIPCAGIDFSGTPFCTNCPVGCPSLKPPIDLEEARQVVERYVGLEDFSLADDGLRLTIVAGDPRRACRRLGAKEGYVRMIETAFRRRLVVHAGQPP